MNFDYYQREAMKMAQTNKLVPPLVQYTLKLNGEAGEVAEKVGKIYRDKNGEISDQDWEHIILELGDVLWYVSAIANELGCLLDAVAFENLKKLKRRKEKGTINGSGDNR